MNPHRRPDDAPRPADEPAWEDLLLRVEIAPRVLRLAVDDAPAATPGVVEALRGALAWEARLREALEAMVPAHAPGEPPALPEDAGPREALEWIARLRARNFAMMQRRGIEVWNWRAAHPFFGEATAHQLLLATCRHDAAVMAAVRGAARRAG